MRVRFEQREPAQLGLQCATFRSTPPLAGVAFLRRESTSRCWHRRQRPQLDCFAAASKTDVEPGSVDAGSDDRAVRGLPLDAVDGRWRTRGEVELAYSCVILRRSDESEADTKMICSVLIAFTIQFWRF